MVSWIVICAEKTLVQVTILIHRTVPSLDLSHDLQQLDNTALSILSLPSISALNCDGGGVSGGIVDSLLMVHGRLGNKIG